MTSYPVCVSNEYFGDLKRKKKALKALDLLVEDLHINRELTVNQFLLHPGFVDYFFALTGLLDHDEEKVAGNSAFVIGTLADSELGTFRIVNILARPVSDTENAFHQLMHQLFRLLFYSDSEAVMNSSGSIGTLCESKEGREWLLEFVHLSRLLDKVVDLLASKNLCIASNAALTLARLSMEDDGCRFMLVFPRATELVSGLIGALGVDSAGRGMNAAFAIGRCCDFPEGRQLIFDTFFHLVPNLILSLLRMLQCCDAGSNKNACFCLSCLCQLEEGHEAVMQSSCHKELTACLVDAIDNGEDLETSWFAVMALKTLVSRPNGCALIKSNNSLVDKIKDAMISPLLTDDIKEEVDLLLLLLEGLPILDKIHVINISSSQVTVVWEAVSVRCGLACCYQLLRDGQSVYEGADLTFSDQGLTPFTQYSYQLRLVTEFDEGPLSAPVQVITEQSVPGAPSNLHCSVVSTSQLKLHWQAPVKPSGILRHYQVFLDNELVEQTHNLTAPISGLSPATCYRVQVYASTDKGRGAPSSLEVTTADLGSLASPEQLNISLHSGTATLSNSKTEVQANWRPPQDLVGELQSYQLTLINPPVKSSSSSAVNTPPPLVLYTGLQLAWRGVAPPLLPQHEYLFSVTAVTDEGSWESERFVCSLTPPRQRENPPVATEPEAVKHRHTFKRHCCAQDADCCGESEFRRVRSATASAKLFRRLSQPKIRRDSNSSLETVQPPIRPTSGFKPQKVSNPPPVPEKPRESSPPPIHCDWTPRILAMMSNMRKAQASPPRRDSPSPDLNASRSFGSTASSSPIPIQLHKVKLEKEHPWKLASNNNNNNGKLNSNSSAIVTNKLEENEETTRKTVTKPPPATTLRPAIRQNAAGREQQSKEFSVSFSEDPVKLRPLPANSKPLPPLTAQENKVMVENCSLEPSTSKSSSVSIFREARGLKLVPTGAAKSLEPSPPKASTVVPTSRVKHLVPTSHTASSSAPVVLGAPTKYRIMPQHQSEPTNIQLTNPTTNPALLPRKVVVLKLTSADRLSATPIYRPHQRKPGEADEQTGNSAKSLLTPRLTWPSTAGAKFESSPLSLRALVPPSSGDDGRPREGPVVPSGPSKEEQQHRRLRSQVVMLQRLASHSLVSQPSQNSRLLKLRPLSSLSMAQMYTGFAPPMGFPSDATLRYS